MYEIASTKRDTNTQGEAVYHQFAAKLRYNHVEMTKDPDMPKFIKEFMDKCELFANNKGRN